jgi:hypothetical protein
MADLLTNLAAAAGQAGGDGAYIEDVFSTYLYTGNGSTQTITNGIDLDGEGGMVWIKMPQSYAISTCFTTLKEVSASDWRAITNPQRVRLMRWI